MRSSASWGPEMRKKVLDPMGWMQGQPFEHVLQVGPGVVPV